MCTKRYTCTVCTHTVHSSLGFGVQRMSYFGNSFGLVTLLWRQTEEQVANIKHFTSTATRANTHPPASIQIHTCTQTRFPCSSSASLVIPRNNVPKGRMCCSKLTSWLFSQQQSMIAALLTALSRTLRSCLCASLTHNKTWQGASITRYTQYCVVAIWLMKFIGCFRPDRERKNRFSLLQVVI